MNAIVPDTFQGAVILSVIDFFLSFIIISGIGFVLSLFPLLNRASAAFAGKPAKEEKKEVAKKVEAVKPAVVADELDDMAAIAAAVYVAMDGAPHRIIHIEPSISGAWVAGGRLEHHASHAKR